MSHKCWNCGCKIEMHGDQWAHIDHFPKYEGSMPSHSKLTLFGFKECFCSLAEEYVEKETKLCREGKL